MKQSFMKLGAVVFLSLFGSVTLLAQLVKNDRMFSFEESQVPACISSESSKLSISPEHYKDGTHSLLWTFQPNATLSLKKDLKFEKKDPTGKDLYLSAFIVWIYNERPQDKKIEFEFLKDGKVCTSFPFGINFKGWRAAWVNLSNSFLTASNEEATLESNSIKKLVHQRVTQSITTTLPATL